MNDYSEKQRINEYLEAYWRELKGDRKYPNESEIDIAELKPIWDSCFLVKVEKSKSDELDFSYAYLGTDLIEAYGEDSTDKEICEQLAYPSSMSLLHKFREVVETEDSVEEDNEFINTQNMLIKYRSNMMPLGHNDGTDGIEFILGGMKWRSY